MPSFPTRTQISLVLSSLTSHISLLLTASTFHMSKWSGLALIPRLTRLAFFDRIIPHVMCQGALQHCGLLEVLVIAGVSRPCPNPLGGIVTLKIDDGRLGEGYFEAAMIIGWQRRNA